jgi:hypothetical protein
MCVFNEEHQEQLCSEAGCPWPGEPCKLLWPKTEDLMREAEQVAPPPGSIYAPASRSTWEG